MDFVISSLLILSGRYYHQSIGFNNLVKDQNGTYQCVLEEYTAVLQIIVLRGHNRVHFAHRLQCTVTLNSNVTILKI